MATVTLAQHIEGFPAAGQKRSYAALLPSGGGGDGIFKGVRAAEAAGVAGAAAANSGAVAAAMANRATAGARTGTGSDAAGRSLDAPQPISTTGSGP